MITDAPILQRAIAAALLALVVSTAAPARAALLADAPTRVQVFPGPGALLITYVPASAAAGYNVYRRTTGRPADQAVRVNAQPITTTWLVDDGQGQGLPDGVPFIYFVRAMLRDAGNSLSEGPPTSEVAAAPQTPILGDFFAYDIGTTDPSAVTLENGVLTVKASGQDMWDQQDSGTFIGKAVAGDYNVSVRMLAKPTGGHPFSAKGRVIIREGLVPRDRYAFAMVMSGRGVYFEGRRSLGAVNFDEFAQPGTDPAHTVMPIWLKLVKRGGRIAAFQSSDGTSFTAIGTVQDYGAMAPVTYAGLGACAVNVNYPPYRYVTDRFDATSVRIEPLGP
jgi:hypothetical protein